MIAPNRIATRLIGSGLGMLLLFLAASIWPLHWWGINFTAYLPLGISIAALIGGLGIAFALHRAAPTLLLKLPKMQSWIWSLGIALGMWYLFYNLVSATQLYGDTRSVLIALGPGGEIEHDHHFLSAWNPNLLSTQNGEVFTYGLMAGIRDVLGCSVWGAFRVLCAALGLVYAFVWMEFVQRKFTTLPTRVLGAAIGLTAGITQVFYGHPEVYAAPTLAFTAYLIALVQAIETRQRNWFIGAGCLLLLAIRSHSAGFALVPTFGYAMLVAWAGAVPSRQAWLGWRRAGGWIPAVCVTIGAIAYFTLFKAGAEHLDTQGNGRNIFLKLIGDNTADNAYAMLSVWHIWDFGQELLLCAAVAIAILLAFGTGLLRKLGGSAPAEIAVAIGMLMLCGLYFAIDPLLSMPRDWDLCGLMAPPMIVLAALLLARAADQLAHNWLPIGLLLGIGGLQMTSVIVNHDPQAVHLRLIATAKHTFMSQHGGGAFYLRHAVEDLHADGKTSSQLINQAVAELKPFENAANRSDFAFLVQYAGFMAFNIQDYALAISHYQSALAMKPKEFMSYQELATAEWKLGNVEDALAHAESSIRLEPDHVKAYAIGIRTALALGKRDVAAKVGDQYTQRFADDPEKLAAIIAQVRDTIALPLMDTAARQ